MCNHSEDSGLRRYWQRQLDNLRAHAAGDESVPVDTVAIDHFGDVEGAIEHYETLLKLIEEL